MPTTTLPAKARLNVPRPQLRYTRHRRRRLNLSLEAEVAAAQSSGADYLGVYVVPLLPYPYPSQSPIPVPDRHHDLGLPCFTGQVVVAAAPARRIPILEACLAHHDFKSLIVDSPDTPPNLRAGGVRHNTRRNNNLLRRLTCKAGIILKRHPHLFQHSFSTRPVPLHRRAPHNNSNSKQSVKLVLLLIVMGISHKPSWEHYKLSSSSQLM
jgi:hypothetical protein